MTRGEKAEALFLQGYNCTQSVVLSFSDLLPLDKETLAKMSSSFGGGVGRLREVCGAVSGMAIVAGFLSGYASPDAKEEKAEHYARIQSLCNKFSEINGSIVCRELLGLSNAAVSPVPEERTEHYYKKRPCAELCKIASDILSEEFEKGIGDD